MKEGSAIISSRGRYRYRLTRGRNPSLICWVMLNPSTADATEDDATIRKLKSFTTRWGFDGFTVVNLYALRSRDPSVLKSHRSPVGKNNWEHIQHSCRSAYRIIGAWGSKIPDRGQAELFLRHYGYEMEVLILNKDGMPRHPLYVPLSTTPQLYREIKK